MIRESKGSIQNNLTTSDLQRLRIDHMRSVPLNRDDQDVLLTAEMLLTDVPLFAATRLFSRVFDSLTNAQRTTLDTLSCCVNAAVHLQVLSGSGKYENVNIDRINRAGHIYLIESQRLLGSLFPTQHEFWKDFYRRMHATSDDRTKFLDIPCDCKSLPHLLFRQFGAFLIPIDALYHLDNGSERLSYELICQSIKWAFAGLYAELFLADCSRKAMFEYAIRMVAELQLSEYDQWIASEVSRLRFDQRDTNKHM